MVTSLDDTEGPGDGNCPTPLAGEQSSEAIRAYASLSDQPASLATRIDLLRRLRALEWRDPRWTDELGVCEHEHKSALKEELRAMSSRQTGITDVDVARAEAVATELASSMWLEPLGGEDIQEVQQFLCGVRRVRMLEKIDSLLTQLDAARDSEAWEHARDLVAELGPMWRDAAIRSEDDRCRVFDRSRRWVDEEFAVRVAAKVQAEAFASFEQACNAGLSWSVSGLIRSRSRIDAAARQLLLTRSRTASGDFAEVFARARTARRRIDRRMAMIVGGASCCGVLLMLAVSTIAVKVHQSRSRNGVVAETRESVFEAVKAGNQQQAREVWKQATDQHAWLASHWLATEVDGAVSELDRSIDAARTSISRIVDQIDHRLQGGGDAALNKLRQACAAVPPSKVDVETARNQASREVADVIREVDVIAARLAAVEATQGKAGIRDMRSAVDRTLLEARRLDGEIEAIVAQAAAAAAQRFRDRLVTIEQMVEAESVGVAEELRKARAQRADMAAFGRSVPRDLEATLARLEVATKSAAVRTALREKLGAAAQAGSGQLLAAVKNLSAAGEEDVHEELVRVAATAPAVEAAEVWAQVARAWKRDLKVSAAEAATWAKLIGIALEAASQPSMDAVDTIRIERLCDFLVDRAAKNTLQRLEPLATYLNARIMQPGVICVTEGDRCLYTRPDADGLRFIDEETLVRRGEFTVTPALAAPHLPLAARLREIVADIVGERIDPDEGIAALLRACVDKQLTGEIDNLLLCRLQGSVLKTASKRVLFGPAAAKLEEAEFRIRAEVGRRPPWVDREQWSSVDAWRKATEAAARVVLAPEEIESILQSYSAERDRLGQPPAACLPLDFVGWVDTTPSVRVRLRQTRLGARSGRLYVIQYGHDARWRLVEIGTLSKDAIVLLPNVRVSFGQPVYSVAH